MDSNSASLSKRSAKPACLQELRGSSNHRESASASVALTFGREQHPVVGCNSMTPAPARNPHRRENHRASSWNSSNSDWSLPEGPLVARLAASGSEGSRLGH